LEYCKNNEMQVKMIERTEGISTSNIKNRLQMK